MKTFKVITPNGYTTFIEGAYVEANAETGQWVIRAITGGFIAAIPKDSLIEDIGYTHSQNTLSHLYTCQSNNL